jgi:hypothetical protein
VRPLALMCCLGTQPQGGALGLHRFLANPARASPRVSRSVSSRNWASKAAKVFAASYFLRQGKFGELDGKEQVKSLSRPHAPLVWLRAGPAGRADLRYPPVPCARPDAARSICSLTSGGGPWTYRTAPQDIKIVGSARFRFTSSPSSP